MIDMDVMVSEQVIQNADGTYTIFINSRLSTASQLKAYQHAMKHIQDGDFEKSNVQEIEYKAHGLPERERIPSVDFEKRLLALRKRRASLKRQLAQYEKKIAVLLAEDPAGFYRRAENQYLYGNDL